MCLSELLTEARFQVGGVRAAKLKTHPHLLMDIKSL